MVGTGESNNDAPGWAVVLSSALAATIDKRKHQEPISSMLERVGCIIISNLLLTKNSWAP
ncbi:MAG: hypothetical protein A2284_11355 [Deltaproteobacteria bacterium RIFOXYA12_FULL_61_11]|nr:MAG: hypothetical protein A2284_11355 [Deltaproteobacteria bacterium RIFOXYA12_FULL_61_11]